jgi:hypothetical protein
VTVVVFAGPTLTPADLGSGEEYRPPAEQGDVYRTALLRPAAIAIVDGRFHDVPSVWHKEVLWALGRGVPVYGAASLGALRAAELHQFGMRGVGWVFEAFRDGRLEDDDEVTVAHAGPEEGFRAVSDAMVNIRRTLLRAASAGVIGAAVRQALVDAIKAVHYPSRTYAELVRLGRAAGLPATELDALERWLPTNRVDQKRLDALTLLTRVRNDLETGDGPASVGFAFNHTVFFETLRRAAPPAAAAATEDGPVTLDELLDELRLDPRTYVATRFRALARLLACRESAGRGSAPTVAHLQATSDRFRRDHGLNDAAATRQWLADNGLTAGGYTVLLRQEHTLAAVTAETHGELAVFMRDQLRADDMYTRLADRIRAKRAWLSEAGLDDPPPDAHDDGALRWYFATRSADVPTDLADYWRKFDFRSEADFLRAVRREHHYSRGEERTWKN